MLYTTSEAATLRAQWPLKQWKDMASKVAWGQQPLCQPLPAPAEPQAPALSNPALHSPRKGWRRTAQVGMAGGQQSI